MEKKTILTFYLLAIASISAGCSASVETNSQNAAPAKLVSQTTQEVAQATPTTPTTPTTPATPAATPQPTVTQQNLYPNQVSPD